MTVTITGGPALSAALRDLGSKVAGRLGTNAVRAGARVIAASARQKAPVGATGELRKSIRVLDDRELNRAQTSERAAGVGSRLFYARFVEFGTIHVRPRSFLRSAVDESAQDALDKLMENLGSGIERETAKYGGR